MKDTKKVCKSQSKTEKKPLVKPGDIKGKVNVDDTRERKDGPGGN